MPSEPLDARAGGQNRKVSLDTITDFQYKDLESGTCPGSTSGKDQEEKRMNSSGLFPRIGFTRKLRSKSRLLWLLPAILLLAGGSEAQNTNPSSTERITQDAPQKTKQSAAFHLRFKPQTIPGTLQSEANGFDRQLAPTTTQMWTWWLYSPYSDIGVYFGGCNAYNSQFVVDGQPSPDQCGTNQISPPNTKQANYNLDNNWLTIVADQGWGAMPIWSGPQAANADGSPCVNNYQQNPQWLMLTDGSTSGTIEADSALARAAALSVSSGIIYYDIEGYDSSTCSTQVINFLISKRLDQ
jgi:hypothetical protein